MEKTYKIDSPKQLLENCKDFFIALADNVRRGLFIKMIESGKTGVSVLDLTASTKLSRPAISHHLKVLKECGLIKARKEGTHNYYYVDVEEHLDNLKRFLDTAQHLSILVN